MRILVLLLLSVLWVNLSYGAPPQSRKLSNTLISDQSKACERLLTAKSPAALQDVWHQFLVFRGVFSGRLIDDKPVLFVDSEETANALPDWEYKGVRIKKVVIQIDQKITSSDGKSPRDRSEARVAKEKLKQALMKGDDQPDWLLGIGLGVQEDGAYNLLVKVTDPEAAKYVPHPFEGYKVVVEVNAIPTTGATMERVYARAQASASRLAEELKSKPWLGRVVVVKHQIGYVDGYVLELRVTDPKVDMNELPVSFEELIVKLKLPKKPR